MSPGSAQASAAHQPPPTSGLREHLGIRYLGVEDGAEVLELLIGPQHLNLAAGLHGGVIATLIDIACALAARKPAPTPVEELSAQDNDLPLDVEGEAGSGRAAVRPVEVATLSLTLNFTRSVRQGRVRVHGRRVAGGRRVVFASADVFDERGRLVANGTGSYAVVA